MSSYIRVCISFFFFFKLKMESKQLIVLHILCGVGMRLFKYHYCEKPLQTRYKRVLKSGIKRYHQHHPYHYIRLYVIFYFVSLPTWYTIIFLFTFTIFYNYSLHVSDRLSHHQENQITRAASGTFQVPDAARVIWFSWWWTSWSETCRE